MQKKLIFHPWKYAHKVKKCRELDKIIKKMDCLMKNLKDNMEVLIHKLLNSGSYTWT